MRTGGVTIAFKVSGASSFPPKSPFETFNKSFDVALRNVWFRYEEPPGDVALVSVSILVRRRDGLGLAD